MTNKVQHSRRKFLIGVTSVVSGVGVAAMATPFLLSMSPSARALAAGAPIEVNVAKLAEGQL